jgi:hypothetical protein
VAQQTVKVAGSGLGHEIFVLDTPYSDVMGFTALNAAMSEVSKVATIAPDTVFSTVTS